MSTSLHVIGFVPPDEKWAQMKTIWDTCKALKIDPPSEVENFFDEGEPDDHGQEMRIPRRDWSDEYRTGIEIDVSAIPPQVKVVRFYVSW